MVSGEELRQFAAQLLRQADEADQRSAETVDDTGGDEPQGDDMSDGLKAHQEQIAREQEKIERTLALRRKAADLERQAQEAERAAESEERALREAQEVAEGLRNEPVHILNTAKHRAMNPFASEPANPPADAPQPSFADSVRQVDQIYRGEK